MTRRTALRVASFLATIALAVAVLPPALASGAPPSATPGSGPNTDLVILKPEYTGVFLTHDAGDSFTLDQSHGTTTMTASATNTGIDSRIAFWDKSAAPMQNSEVCAQWSSQSELLNQEGLLLREKSINGGYKAITLTRNVYTSDPPMNDWDFNVHVWNTVKDNPVYTLVGSYSLQSVFGANDVFLPLPWSVCAEVVGNTFSFLAWPTGTPQPAWGDPDNGRSVTLPAGYDYAGTSGWYFGHLTASDEITYNDLSVTPIAN
jgi:hypothetical protein